MAATWDSPSGSSISDDGRPALGPARVLPRRRFGVRVVAPRVGLLVYVFRAPRLYVDGQPQYFFDLLCLMFCVVALLLGLRGHWILALFSFWVACEAKEIAVTLPIALLARE